MPATSPTGFYPPNPYEEAKLQGHAPEAACAKRAELALKTWTAAEAAAASTTAVKGAAACSASADQTFTTGFTAPPSPRNITATTSGTSGDVKAVSVIVTGTDIDDQVITETLPAFTVNTNETQAGNRAFKTVTQVVVPAMDGTGCNVSIGFGDKLGLPNKLERNTVLHAFLGKAREGTAPTVTTSESSVSNNTVDLNSALNGSQVDVYFMLP